MRRHLALLGSAIWLFSCGGSGGSSGIHGTLSSQFTIAGSTRPMSAGVLQQALGSGVQVNQIWAVPTEHGNVNERLFSRTQKFDIKPDGSFDLSVDKSYDWVLLLIDSTAADKASQVVAYLTMSAADGSQLHNIPVSQSTGNIDMGMVSKDGDQTSTSKTTADNAASFTLTQDQLTQLAKTDRMLRQVKNVYRNYDPATGTYIRIKPYFTWSNYAATSQVVNRFSDPAATVAHDFTGYLYYFHTNNTAIDPTKICNAMETLELYPPATVANVPPSSGPAPGTVSTWSPQKPFTNVGMSTGGSATMNGCGSGDIYFRDDSMREGNPSYQFNYIANNSSLAAPIPQGDWTIEASGGPIAAFDGELGTPFKDDVTPTLPIVLIPSMRVNVASGNIASIEVKWYMRNDDATMSPVTDAAILGAMSSTSVEIDNYSGGGGGSAREMGNIDASSNFTYTPKSSWAYPQQGGSGTVANSIAVSYDFNGISLRFDYRN